MIKLSNNQVTSVFVKMFMDIAQVFKGEIAIVQHYDPIMLLQVLDI